MNYSDETRKAAVVLFEQGVGPNEIARSLDVKRSSTISRRCVPAVAQRERDRKHETKDQANQTDWKRRNAIEKPRTWRPPPRIHPCQCQYPVALVELHQADFPVCGLCGFRIKDERP